MEKEKSNDCVLLVMQDFDPSKTGKLKILKQLLKRPKESNIMSVKAGDIVRTQNNKKYNWWVHVCKNVIGADDRIVEIRGKIPSSILVPIVYDEQITDYFNLNDAEKYKISPDFTSKDRKYFPLIYIYYENIIDHEECRKPKFNLLTNLCYGWMTHYIRLGYHRYLVSGDLWSPKPKESALYYFNKFQALLNKRIENNNKTKEKTKEKKKENNRMSYYPIFTTFVLMFKTEFISSFFLKFFQDLIKFAIPFLIRLIIQHCKVANRSNLWHGIVYSILLFIFSFGNSLILNKYYEYVYLLGGTFRGILISMTYRKMLKIRPKYFALHPLSNQLNLITFDSFKLQEIIGDCNFLWSAPLQIILSLIYLWFELGAAAFPGVGVMLLVLPINYLIVHLIKKNQMEEIRLKDKRIKFINGVLNGIKIVKLYAWEGAFYKYISDIRKEELSKISIIRLLSGFFYSIMNLSPIFISMASFATYIYLNEKLSAETAFVALSIFSIIRFPLTFLPEVISLLTSARISYNRFLEFLTLPEISNDNPSYSIEAPANEEKASLKICDASFSLYENEPPFLENINFQFNVGELHGIIGGNGSGKTFLFEAIINHMCISKGSVEIVGKIAYLPQQPWISNMTVKQNIICDMPFDNTKYRKVIKACELMSDISTLTDGDLTEIGEKGANLSGGQKQRIALARAVYSDSDIYLFDDSLCSIDVAIGKSIFDNVMSDEGLLKNKIRILITHNDSFLHKINFIHILKEGNVIYSGSYQSLLQSDINIEDYIKKGHDDQITHTSTEAKKTVSTKDSIRNFQLHNKKTQLILDEKFEVGSVKRMIYMNYIKAWKIPIFSLFLIFIAFANFFNILTQIWLAQFTSTYILKANCRYFFMGYSGISILQVITTFLYLAFSTIGSYLSCKCFHKKLVDCLLLSPLSFFEKIPIGRIFTIFTKDMNIVDDNIGRSFYSVFNILFTLLFSLISISLKMPYILIIILFLSIFYYYLQAWYIKLARQTRRLDNISMSPLLSHVMNTFDGLDVIKSSQRQNKFISKFDNLLESNLVPYIMTIYANRWLGSRLEFIANILTLLSSLLISFYASFSIILVGYVGHVLNTTTSITQAMSFFIRSRCDLENNLISVERIVEYFKNSPEEDLFFTVEPSKNWPVKGEIIFDCYSCKYRPELPDTLHEISCKICSAEKIGVVGRTGAGKSSLLLSIFRMVEKTHGSILIDGVDISSIGIKYLRQRLSIIPQEPFLFDGCFRDNIDPTHEYTDAEIWDALELSQLKSFISSHEDGLNYKIEEFGKNISSGEKQLICLARALLKRTKILILDEATANVDLKTDRIIQEVIRKQFKNTTIITVAHRLETIMDYDKIIVMEEGKILEFDSPSNLLSSHHSQFYQMVHEVEDRNI